jgi:D-alanyl-lipoteichoic acid acyltransferase DltB (MBOAT superfamily)
VLQNAFVVVASYVFYGWWDWRFLILIAFTSLCSWVSGIMIRNIDNKENANYKKNIRKRKLITATNIVVNLAILAIFKYYDFFAAEFAKLFCLSSEGILLNIVLPVGISFYTFQALSYTIDVYRGKIEPTRDVIAFFAYISFFPQLVAGPIERATSLLPQFLHKREFDYGTAVDGCRQILWGLFKKIVVADNCAIVSTQVFNDYANMPASLLMVGLIFFAFQFYGDFSGYSDIAIGTAKLFGIKLTRNFNVPFFSRNIAEFWRRWHISLTKWMTDYVFIPLSFLLRKWGNVGFVVAVSVNMLVVGLWHGANWTFIVWGAYNAILFLPHIFLSKNRKYAETVAEYRILPSIKDFVLMLKTFLLVVIGGVFFSAENIGDAWHYFISLFRPEVWQVSYRFFSFPTNYEWVFVLILLVVEWLQRGKGHGLEINSIKYKLVRVLIYYIVIIMICIYSEQSETFVYFQF